MKLSIVIPNYNGIKLLRRHLPSVVQHSDGAQIIIVDDASTDESLNWIKKKFPQIKLVVNPKNIGFARSVNLGFQSTSADLVLLLNSDVSINSKTIKKLIPHFQNSNVFAVGSLEKLPRGKRRGKSKARFKRGLLVHSKSNVQKSGPTLWVFGASGMFRKSLWNQLGGFDPLFHPAYYEDIDICYRAWKAGYKSLFEPRATVEHDSEATMNTALGSKKTAFVFKNQLLFFWKNITSLQLILSHLLWLPYHLTLTSVKTRGAFTLGLIMALGQLTRVNRHQSNLQNKHTDQEVIKRASS